MMMRNIAIGLTALVIAAAGPSLSASAKPPGGEARAHTVLLGGEQDRVIFDGPALQIRRRDSPADSTAR